MKLVSPKTAMVDPQKNLAFFVFAFLSLNAEWYAYSVGFRTIVDPFVYGLNKQSDRKALTAVSRALDITKGVPISDMILRVVLVIVPALVAAATDNDTLMIWVYFFSRLYSLVKYMAFGATYGMCFKIMVNIRSTDDRSSSSTGSTNTSLEDFCVKIRFIANMVLFIMCPGCVLYAGYLTMMRGNFCYSICFISFLNVRAFFAFLHAILMEILYLDMFPLLLDRYNRWRNKDTQENALNTVTGSFGIKARDEEENSFDGQNPMRTSKSRVPNPAP